MEQMLIRAIHKDKIVEVRVNSTLTYAQYQTTKIDPTNIHLCVSEPALYFLNPSNYYWTLNSTLTNLQLLPRLIGGMNNAVSQIIAKKLHKGCNIDQIAEDLMMSQEDVKITIERLNLEVSCNHRNCLNLVEKACLCEDQATFWCDTHFTVHLQRPILHFAENVNIAMELCGEESVRQHIQTRRQEYAKEELMKQFEKCEIIIDNWFDRVIKQVNQQRETAKSNFQKIRYNVEDAIQFQEFLPPDLMPIDTQLPKFPYKTIEQELLPGLQKLSQKIQIIKVQPTNPPEIGVIPPLRPPTNPRHLARTMALPSPPSPPTLSSCTSNPNILINPPELTLQVNRSYDQISSSANNSARSSPSPSRPGSGPHLPVNFRHNAQHLQEPKIIHFRTHSQEDWQCYQCQKMFAFNIKACLKCNIARPTGDRFKCKTCNKKTSERYITCKFCGEYRNRTGWHCDQCDIKNHRSTGQCKQCQNLRKYKDKWQCPCENMENKYFYCSICGTQYMGKGVWICKCGKLNKYEHKACQKCKVKREKIPPNAECRVF